jgi:hypothetical protein
MAGHRRFNELKHALLRVPGTAERVAAERRKAEVEILHEDADCGAPSAEEPAGDGPPAPSRRPVRSPKRT